MSDHYRVLSEQERAAVRDPQREFALDILTSLSERPKRLPSKYFYDDAGSDYFRQIMALEEYYPTECETQILTDHGRSILATCGSASLDIIDLGAGDGSKTSILLAESVAAGIECRYVPIDISVGAMETLTSVMRQRFDSVEVAGLVADYAEGLRWLALEREQTRASLVLFLGSNIGNFDKPRARAFLRLLWTALEHGDYVLIGFDLKKDIDVMLHAYNDGQGVTAAFNKNLLARINRELGGNFNLDAFRHYGTYDVMSGAMKSYLVSLDRQTVEIDSLGRVFEFEPYEPIHTEYSYKYLDSDIEGLASDTGFVIESTYRDQRRYFVDSLWRVEKSGVSP